MQTDRRLFFSFFFYAAGCPSPSRPYTCCPSISLSINIRLLPVIPSFFKTVAAQSSVIIARGGGKDRSLSSGEQSEKEKHGESESGGDLFSKPCMGNARGFVCWAWLAGLNLASLSLYQPIYSHSLFFGSLKTSRVGWEGGPAGN